MSNLKEVTSRVTRKGQVTIPADFRKAHDIKKGSRVSFRTKKNGDLILVSIPNLEDLAGADAGRVTYGNAVRKLDRMRENDRY